jgi:pimeloyl-ACP methyl ester carboxylesterase/class 3 adenylate cyclase
MTPDVHYAKSGEVHIAYQILGAGPCDLVLVPGWVSNIDVFWEEPGLARFLNRLASFTRLILFDKRGTGLSDRVTLTPMLEERMEDVRAVLDAVGSQRAALFGYSEGGPMCALFAVTYPERVSGLIMHGSYARRLTAADYPYGMDPAEYERFLLEIERHWGTAVGYDLRLPSRRHDEQLRRWWARMLRSGASPMTAVALTRANAEIDVRPVLSSIRVPTLILHATGDRSISFEGGRYLAEHIPGARFVALASEDHIPWVGCPEIILDQIERFLTGARRSVDIDRIVSTIMFTDIVHSTQRAAELGDQRWRDLLDAHHTCVRAELAVYRGREIKTTGDGFHATFDGPARAIRCAQTVSAAVRELGLALRIGLHTGECEVKRETVEGLAIHIAARVAAQARTGEILVSQTVKDLVAGSGLRFEPRGEHQLKGLPDAWRLFAVVA